MDRAGVISVLRKAERAAELPRLGGMARAEGVVIASEHFWAFARRDGTISEGTMPTPPAAVRRVPLLRGLVRTFQISRELGELTVLENLLFARPNQTGESVWKAFAFPRRVRREERAAADRAHAILERVGLWRLADHPARGLSGGQKKLLELCRALMLDPKVVLLDEPAAGLSPPMRAEISRVIRTLCDEGITFVIVEHDMDMVASICERIYVFAEGTNLTCGSFKEIAADRRVVDAYLGGLK